MGGLDQNQAEHELDKSEMGRRYSGQSHLSNAEEEGEGS